MSPCPFPTYSSLLRPLALWCLDTFGEGPPMLIGVSLGGMAAHFQPIELCDEDPVDDMADLLAPDRWDVLVVVAPTEAGSEIRGGTVAHAVDRFGASATELDDFCGRRRSLRMLRGRLHEACLEVFVPLGH
jgi:hypothetical protein